MPEQQQFDHYKAGRVRQRQLAECSDHECIALAELISARKKRGLPIHQLEADLRLEYTRMKYATQILNAL